MGRWPLLEATEALGFLALVLNKVEPALEPDTSIRCSQELRGWRGLGWGITTVSVLIFTDVDKRMKNIIDTWSWPVPGEGGLLSLPTKHKSHRSLAASLRADAGAF